MKLSLLLPLLALLAAPPPKEGATGKVTDVAKKVLRGTPVIKPAGNGHHLVITVPERAAVIPVKAPSPCKTITCKCVPK